MTATAMKNEIPLMTRNAVEKELYDWPGATLVKLEILRRIQFLKLSYSIHLLQSIRGSMSFNLYIKKMPRRFLFSRSDGDGGFGLISSEGLVLGKVEMEGKCVSYNFLLYTNASRQEKRKTFCLKHKIISLGGLFFRRNHIFSFWIEASLSQSLNLL